MLELTRGSGRKEFVIREKARAKVTRVIGWEEGKENLKADVPLEIEGTCLPAAPPSETFCRAMVEKYEQRIADFKSQGKPAPQATAELQYWQDRCDESRTPMGAAAMDKAIAVTEERLADATNPQAQKRIGRPAGILA